LSTENETEKQVDTVSYEVTNKDTLIITLAFNRTKKRQKRQSFIGEFVDYIPGLVIIL